MPIPVAARSKGWVCGRSLAGIVGSNLTGDGGHWCLSLVSVVCCQVSDLCVGLTTRPEKSYRVRCVWVWSWILDKEALAHWGQLRHGEKKNKNNDKFIFRRLLTEKPFIRQFSSCLTAKNQTQFWLAFNTFYSEKSHTRAVLTWSNQTSPLLSWCIRQLRNFCSLEHLGDMNSKQQAYRSVSPADSS